MDQTSLGKVFTDLKHMPLNERVDAYYLFLKSAGRLPQVERVPVKSVEQAKAFRILGDQYTIRSEYVNALKLYTKSAAAAPPDSSELAVAYALRSAILMKVKRDKPAIVDINRALKENLPGSAKTKIRLQRRELSKKILEHDHRLLGMMKILTKLDISEEDKKANELELKHTELECSFDVNSTDLNYEHKFFLPDVNFKNKTIPNASEKVRIEYSSEFGRHIVAVQDLKPGEEIAIEKPYSSILSWEKALNHCSYCFVKCEALMPCPNCSEVLFCSKRCLDDATNRFHRIECQILSLSGYPVTTNLEWKVIRLLMMVTKQGKELEDMMVHPVYKDPLLKTTDKVPDQFDSKDYATIHNLPDHRDKRSDFDLWMAVHMTANLIHILKHTTFLEEKKDGNKFSLQEKEKYLGQLLLKFVFLKSQTYEINEFHEWAMTSTGSDRMSGIGSGFYSFHCLFNHSCDANVLKTFHKDVIVTYATAPIKAGEQLFVNYGKSYEIDARKERQKFLLQNFFFTCKCNPCAQNWPLADELKTADAEIKKMKKLRRHAKEMLEYFGVGAIRNQYSARPYNLLSDHLTMLHENTTRPNLDCYVYQRDLHRMLCARGNYYSLECDGELGSL